MKKFFVFILCLLFVLGCFSACGNSEDAQTARDDQLRVVTTIFPEYDWVRNIAGDHAQITLLLDNGVDLHSYQPTADDIVKIVDADLFIYVGGESDSWVKDALKEVQNDHLQVMNLLEVLGDAVKEEELVGSMEEETEADEAPEYDEHVWLSLRNAQVLCSAIAETLCALDPAHAADYTANVTAYNAQLQTLDAAYQAVVDAAPIHTLLFGDRFPFRYLTDDYGLTYDAAFVGCSAETEASFETIAKLASKVDALGLHSILQIETSDGSIANTIRQTTQTKDQKILTMDSLQSKTSRDVANGASYLDAMQKNLEVLKEALN